MERHKCEAVEKKNQKSLSEFSLSENESCVENALLMTTQPRYASHTTEQLGVDGRKEGGNSLGCLQCREGNSEGRKKLFWKWKSAEIRRLVSLH